MIDAFLVYVWIPGRDVPVALRQFIDRYVAPDQTEPRFAALVRTHVESAPAEDDRALLQELRRDADAMSAFSIYLRAAAHTEAVVTVTEESDLVLGLGLAPSSNSWETVERFLHELVKEFDAVGGIGGGDGLAPPQSAAEWAEDGLVHVRVGRNP